MSRRPPPPPPSAVDSHADTIRSEIESHRLSAIKYSALNQALPIKTAPFKPKLFERFESPVEDDEAPLDVLLKKTDISNPYSIHRTVYQDKEPDVNPARVRQSISSVVNSFIERTAPSETNPEGMAFKPLNAGAVGNDALGYARDRRDNDAGTPVAPRYPMLNWQIPQPSVLDKSIQHLVEDYEFYQRLVPGYYGGVREDNLTAIFYNGVGNVLFNDAKGLDSTRVDLNGILTANAAAYNALGYGTPIPAADARVGQPWLVMGADPTLGERICDEAFKVTAAGTDFATLNGGLITAPIGNATTGIIAQARAAGGFLDTATNNLITVTGQLNALEAAKPKAQRDLDLANATAAGNAAAIATARDSVKEWDDKNLDVVNAQTERDEVEANIVALEQFRDALHAHWDLYRLYTQAVQLRFRQVRDELKRRAIMRRQFSVHLLDDLTKLFQHLDGMFNNAQPFTDRYRAIVEGRQRLNNAATLFAPADLDAKTRAIIGRPNFANEMNGFASGAVGVVRVAKSAALGGIGTL